MTRAERYYHRCDRPCFDEPFYNARVRRAIIRAYEAGYRQARKDNGLVKPLGEVDDE